MGNFLCNDCGVAGMPELHACKCGEDFGQIQVAAFVVKDANGAWPYIPANEEVGSETEEMRLTDKSNIVVKDNWMLFLDSDTCMFDPYTSLDDEVTYDQVVQISPLLYNPTTNPGEEKTWGGGNASIDGVELSLGAGATTMTFEMRKVKQYVVKNLKKLQCLAEQGKLYVYLFDGNGAITGVAGIREETVTPESGTPTTVTIPCLFPIPVASLFVGDKNFAGLDELDYNSMTIRFAPNYSDNLVIEKLGTTDVDSWIGRDLLF